MTAFEGWRKSSRSQRVNNCVMVRGDLAALGDSKDPTPRPLTIGRGALGALVSSLRS